MNRFLDLCDVPVAGSASSGCGLGSINGRGVTADEEKFAPILDAGLFQ